MVVNKLTIKAIMADRDEYLKINAEINHVIINKRKSCKL